MSDLKSVDLTELERLRFKQLEYKIYPPFVYDATNGIVYDATNGTYGQLIIEEFGSYVRPLVMSPEAHATVRISWWRRFFSWLRW